MKTDQSLPKIVVVLDCIDHGPCDDGATASCPHCGADGRFVYHFLCADGTIRGAMKGCIQLFPFSKAASECEKALKKQADAKHGKGFLSKWDSRVLDALEQFKANCLSMGDLERICDAVKNEKRHWMIQKGYIRC